MELYERIAQRVSNLILQNAVAIETAFEKNRLFASDPATITFPVVIKVELSRMGEDTSHKEKIEWKIQSKEQVETDEEIYCPNQPGLFDES